MSSDNQEIKVERRRSKESIEDRNVVDSTDQNSQPKVERRRKRSGIHGGSNLTTKYEKYIPAGYRGRFVNPSKDRPQYLYDNDWEFAKDENGSRIYLTANHGKDAEENKFILMIKKEEYWQADKADERAARKERLADTPTLSKEEKSSDFFKDTGLAKDHV